MALPAFLASEFEPASPEMAAFHVIPVPYEQTVSYGHGTAQGPKAILEASQQLEAFDGRGCPGKAGIHTTNPPDLSGPPETALEALAQMAAEAVKKGAIPIALGGEHTITAGVVKGLQSQLGKSFGVIQFDAHADLRQNYEGTPWSHACAMRRLLDMGVPILQIGVRSLAAEEADVRIAKMVPHLDARELQQEGYQGLASALATFPADVYVSFDVDALDASVMPATGTPEPGGLFWWDVISLLEGCLKDRRLVGADVVELAPIAGLHHCDYTAAKLVYTLMGLAG